MLLIFLVNQFFLHILNYVQHMCKSEKVKFIKKRALLHGKIKNISMLLKHNQGGKVGVTWVKTINLKISVSRMACKYNVISSFINSLTYLGALASGFRDTPSQFLGAWTLKI